MTANLQHDRGNVRIVAEVLVGIGALALLTWLGVRFQIRIATVAMLYFAIIVLVALRGSLVPALVTAIGSAVALHYFFTPPRLAFSTSQLRDFVALITYAATAVVITRLITALRANEQRWRDVFENNPTMYFIVEPAGKIVSVNSFGAEQLGYTVDELVGQSVLNVFPQDEREAARQHVADCLASIGQPRSWEIRKVRKDGTLLWVRETARAVQRVTGKPIVLIACEDITDRKAAQETLRQNEADLLQQASLLDLSHDTIFVRDRNDVIRYWNRGAEERYGWSRDEAIGKVSHQLTQTIFPARLEEITAQLVRTGRWEGELTHTRRDGTQLVVASRWSLQRDEQGEPAGVLETNNDITQRKRAEETLRESETRLRDAQADLARVATVTTMGELAASLAHELRQPLAAIVMNGSAALRWLNRPEPQLEEARDAASRVVRDAQRADEVIRGLRTLVEKSALSRSTLDLNSAVEQVLELANAEVRRHGVSVHTELAVDLPLAFGDRVQVQQVLLNLIMNGIEAMSAVTDRPKALLIRTAAADGSGIAVEVKDTGSGLDPAVADRIFDPFFTTKPNGLGMGLSICRSIIEAHGGTFRASPRLPHGTVFRFTVPALADAKENRETA